MPEQFIRIRRVRKALDLLERKFNRQNSQPQA
jgi:hypothetical protein